MSLSVAILVQVSLDTRGASGVVLALSAGHNAVFALSQRMTSPSAFAMQLAWRCLQGTMQWQQVYNFGFDGSAEEDFGPGFSGESLYEEPDLYNFGFDGSAEAGFEGENLYAEPDWPDFIDIVEELLRVSNQALLLIDEAIVQSEALREGLLYMRTTFESVMNTPANDLRGAWDDLESRIATVLTQLENDEAPTKLQGMARDTLILLCSRGLDQQIMRGIGIPHQLVCRICAAFATATCAMPDVVVWSKLGNAKFHVFTKGSRFYKHRRLPRRVALKRKLRKALADEAAGSSAAAASSSAAAASPLPPPLALEFFDDEWLGHGAGGMQAASSSAAAASPLPPPLALEFFDDEWCIVYKF